MLMARTIASATLRSAGTWVGSRSAASVLCMLTVMMGPPGWGAPEGAIAPPLLKGCPFP